MADETPYASGGYTSNGDQPVIIIACDGVMSRALMEKLRHSYSAGRHGIVTLDSEIGPVSQPVTVTFERPSPRPTR